MRSIKLGTSGLDVPVVAMGCMRISSIEKEQAENLVATALENGANFFDHADIYGDGECETIFGGVIKNLGIAREKMIIQTKCGIHRVDGRAISFDFSRDYIISAVEGSLRRLGMDYIDVLLLHRPDTLFEPDEVARAFDELKASGKVRHFGVSNQNPGMIELLKKYCKVPIVANQLQLSAAFSPMINAGFHVNTNSDFATNRDGGILEYCRLNDITIQPWSPFQFGFFEGVFIGNPKYFELNAVLDRIGEKYSVNSTTVAMAWLLRHPARLQPVTGTTNPSRFVDCLKAADITLTREEWYEIWMAAGNFLP